MSATFLAPLLVGIMGPLLTFVVLTRRMSGKIATSEAKDLWEESAKLRADLQYRNEQLHRIIDKTEARVRACEQKIESLEGRNQKLFLENGTLRKTLAEHEETIRELRYQIHQLSERNQQLVQENRVLRARVTELEAKNGGT